MYLQLVRLILHLAKPRVNPVADELVVLQHTDFLYSCLQVLDFPLGEYEYKFPAHQIANRDSYTLNSLFRHQCAPHLGAQGGGDIDLKILGKFQMI